MEDGSGRGCVGACWSARHGITSSLADIAAPPVKIPRRPMAPAMLPSTPIYFAPLQRLRLVRLLPYLPLYQQASSRLPSPLPAPSPSLPPSCPDLISPPPLANDTPDCHSFFDSASRPQRSVTLRRPPLEPISSPSSWLLPHAALSIRGLHLPPRVARPPLGTVPSPLSCLITSPSHPPTLISTPTPSPPSNPHATAHALPGANQGPKSPSAPPRTTFLCKEVGRREGAIARVKQLESKSHSPEGLTLFMFVYASAQAQLQSPDDTLATHLWPRGPVVRWLPCV